MDASETFVVISTILSVYPLGVLGFSYCILKLIHKSYQLSNRNKIKIIISLKLVAVLWYTIAFINLYTLKLLLVFEFFVLFVKIFIYNFSCKTFLTIIGTSVFSHLIICETYKIIANKILQFLVHNLGICIVILGLKEYLKSYTLEQIINYTEKVLYFYLNLFPKILCIIWILKESYSISKFLLILIPIVIYWDYTFFKIKKFNFLYKCVLCRHESFINNTINLKYNTNCKEECTICYKKCTEMILCTKCKKVSVCLECCKEWSESKKQ